MNTLFTKHNFKPKEKLTAQMLNELEAYVFELLLSKTYCFDFTKVTFVTNPEDPFQGVCDHLAAEDVINSKLFAGIEFDGEKYICPAIRLTAGEDAEGNTDYKYLIGNISAYVKLIVEIETDMPFDNLSEEERQALLAMFSQEFGISLDELYLLMRESTLPFLLQIDNGNNICFLVKDGELNLSEDFGTHSVNILLADTEASKLTSIAAIQLGDPADSTHRFKVGTDYKMTGLGIKDYFTMMSYSDVLVKVGKEYCLMHFTDGDFAVGDNDAGYFVATTLRTNDNNKHVKMYFELKELNNSAIAAIPESFTFAGSTEASTL